MNKVFLLGHVGTDPVMRYADRSPVASFTLATNERAYTTASGATIPERTEWHNIVMWNKNAEIAEKYIRKGTRLLIEGKIRTRTWEDRSAIKRTITEIYVETFEFLGGPQVPQTPAPQNPQPAQQRPISTYPQPGQSQSQPSGIQTGAQASGQSIGQSMGQSNGQQNPQQGFQGYSGQQGLHGFAPTQQNDDLPF